MTPLKSNPAGPLSGQAAVPGDKSISHRALILGASATGETRIQGLLEGHDVLCTAAALRALGVTVDDQGGGSWRVLGRGVGGLTEPASVLDLGNSGTGVRLLMGLVASHGFGCVFAGDASLSSRPMERVMEPLRRMGAAFQSRSGGRLPVTVTGTASPVPIDFEPPQASAQVKSAVLLAGLNTPGRTTVSEARATRDHTERMLTAFGADVTVEDDGDAKRITLEGRPELAGREVVVPGDVSSAAFPMVAALLVEGSAIDLPGVGVNPLRAGLLETLAEMGADIRLSNQRQEGGEPVADIAVRAGPLRGVEVPAARAPAMIDEYPILAVAAASAEGTTRMEGLAELRIKECDRLAVMANGLAACGVEVEEGEESLTIHGRPGRLPGGAGVAVDRDHRIAMAFLVLGMAAEAPVAVDDAASIDTSFPGFTDFMNGLGAQLGGAP